MDYGDQMDSLKRLALIEAEIKTIKENIKEIRELDKNIKELKEEIATLRGIISGIKSMLWIFIPLAALAGVFFEIVDHMKGFFK